MPELPEVEIFKRFTEAHAVGRRIEAVDVLNPRILKGASPKVLEKAVRGHRFTRARRHGKTLFLGLDGGKAPWLLLHFGMTGYLSRFEDESDILTAYGDHESGRNHIRVRFDLEDGSRFAFHEQRMFGKLGLIDDPDAYIAEKKLGPDALSISRADFAERLRRRKGALKPALMDQALVAGMGNVYVDETLFQCRLHPLVQVASLADEDIGCLHARMIEVLRETIDADVDRDRLPESYLTHVRRKKGRCPRDNTRLAIEEVGGRTTYFCPKCQRLPEGAA